MGTTLQSKEAQIASAAVAHLRQVTPHLLAVYLFGSQADGTQTTQSDWDFTLWVDGKLEPLEVWSLAHQLSGICGTEVDLVDMRTTSTVMQYQVITHGVRIWARSEKVDILEAMVLSDKINLDEARGPLLERILAQGEIYGR